MELILHTEGWFDAAHHLENYEGKCKNIHGHTYKVEVWIKGDSSQLDKAGILWDFGNLTNKLKDLDHPKEGELNNLLGINPTAENISMILFYGLNKINPNLKYKVRVYEQIQPKECWCECGDF